MVMMAPFFGGIPGALFDGVNDYLSIDPLYSGSNDNKFLLSMWVAPESLGSAAWILQGRATGSSVAEIFRIYLKADGTLQFIGNNSQGLGLLDVTSGVALTAGQINHVLFSCDLSDTAKRHFLINDADASPTWSIYGDSLPVSVNDAEWSLGSQTDGTGKFNGGIALPFFSVTQYYDVETNKRDFIDANGQPVGLGSDGGTPTGTAPEYYSAKSGNGLAANSGNAGDWVVTGGLEANPYKLVV